MEIFHNDLIFGSFRLSEHGLLAGSFSYQGESEDDTGMGISTIEEFIGHSPVPVYLGQKYTDKLRLQATLIKNPNVFPNDPYFSEKDCRSILRTLTGLKGYQWLKLISREPSEDLWYRARTISVSYKHTGGHIAGIVLNMECDSCFAWSGEYNISIKVKANQPFFIYNDTDDRNSYVYPTVSIRSSSAGSISFANISDGSRTSVVRNVKEGEKITIDSRRQLISSDAPHDLLLNDFNLGWFRLVPDKNEYLSDSDAAVSMKFRVPRKVGIVE